MIDFGGNVGITALLLSSTFPDAVVYAIEPVLGNFNVMVKNIINNNKTNIIPYNVGVYERACIMSLGVPRASAARNTGLYSVKHTECVEKCVMVPLSSLHLPCAEVVKVDIEGCEYPLLCGNKEYFRGVSVILIELNESVSDIDRIREVLFEMGFVCENVEGLGRHPKGGYLVGDLMYVNTQVLRDGRR